MADYWMDGTSYIVYDDGVDEWSDTCGEYCQGVGLATCTAGACSTTQIATINVYATIGAVVTIGADGNPAVVYEDSGFGYEGLPNLVHYYTNESDVVVASNACAAGVRGECGGGIKAQDMAMGPDGFARIAYWSAPNVPEDVDFILCADAACSAHSTSPIFFSWQGDSDLALSLAVGADGEARISGGSDYLRCWTADCSSYSDQTVPGSWTGGSISLAALDGNPRIVRC